MYNLVIVDDEQIVRDGLCTFVDWAELGFELVGVFSDGQQVIECLEYYLVDVIFTDIMLKTMTGLDIAKYVQKSGLNCEVLLISGHQEFELALQGIKYGAFDYLLKPTDADTVKATFARIKEKLDKKGVNNNVKVRLEQALPLLKERFFVDLILGVVDNPEDIQRKMGILYPTIDLENSFCCLLDIEINDYSDFMKYKWHYGYDQFEINLNNFLSLYQGNFCYHLIYKSNGILEIFALYNNRGVFDSGLVNGELNKFVKDIDEIFGCHSNYRIKKTFNTIYQVLGYVETISNDSVQDSSVPMRLNEQKKLIVSYVTGGNIAVAQKIFGNLFDSLAETNIVYRNNFCIDVFSTIMEVLKNTNAQLFDQMRAYVNYSKIATLFDSAQAKLYFDKIFDRIRSTAFKAQGNQFTNSDNLISKIKQYISAHITEDISLEKTANELFISSSYLSRIFKSATGENFSQFVTKMKIEKAIELLSDDSLKIYHIINQLGYKMPRYFSKLFKTYTGMNPIEYRLKVLNMRGGNDEIL